MKVINVISDTNFGGAGRCLLNFLDNYNRDEIDLEIFLPIGSVLSKKIAKRNVKFLEIPHIGDKSLNPRAISVLYKLFKAKNPHIVHSHATMSARIAAKMYGKCKIVYTRHSVFDQSSAKKKNYRKFLYGCVDNFTSDKIIAVSPAAKQNIVEIGAKESNIDVIFNGVDAVEKLPINAKNEIRKLYGISEKNFVVSIIARLEEVKGHKYVLEAAKILQNLEPNIKIIIAGTGSIEEDLKLIAAEKNLTNVIITGFIKEIYKIENITDLQINASYGTEATSLSLLEGFSLGIPAVVSDFGGNPFVVIDNDSGFVFPKNNVDALVSKIIKIYNDKELYQKLSQGAKKSFEEKFTSKVMTDNISKLYKNMMEV